MNETPPIIKKRIICILKVHKKSKVGRVSWKGINYPVYKCTYCGELTLPPSANIEDREGAMNVWMSGGS